MRMIKFSFLKMEHCYNLHFGMTFEIFCFKTLRQNENAQASLQATLKI